MKLKKLEIVNVYRNISVCPVCGGKVEKTFDYFEGSVYYHCRLCNIRFRRVYNVPVVPKYVS